jgi:hypothetical protein
MFKREVEKMGIECSIMKYWDEMEVQIIKEASNEY